MIDLLPNLSVGTADEYENVISKLDGYSIVHACKEPYHRRLLGYTTQGAPKEHPEYLWAIRGDRLYLNLVDAPKVEFIPKEVIETALDFIDAELLEGKKVFLHCNQGESRAPSIALLHLYKTGVLKGSSSEVLDQFTKLYPNYAPGQGMLDFVVNYIQNGGGA